MVSNLIDLQNSRDDIANIRINKVQELNDIIKDFLNDRKFKFLLYNTDIDTKYLNNNELENIKTTKCNKCGQKGMVFH